MQYLLTAENIKATEQAHFAKGNDSFAVMKKASEAVCNIVGERFPNRSIIVLAGTGNNGGDGLLTAECLHKKGFDVKVYALEASKMKGDAAKALKACSVKILPVDVLNLEGNPVVIDALFGIGLNKSLPDEIVKLITTINAHKLDVVSVDIPSGVMPDSGRIAGAALQAASTVTFIAHKFAQVLMPAREFFGEVILADIGIPIEAGEISSCINIPENWFKYYPWPKPSGNKYSRGHTLVAGGNKFKCGAAKLAANAALRSGSGLVTIICAEEDVPAYASDAYSLMTTSDTQWSDLLQDKRVNSLLIGPGAGVNETIYNRVMQILKAKKSTVLDADALSVFAQKPEELFAAIESPCILTPHGGEFERLFPELKDLPKHEAARKAAVFSNAVVIYKGYDTVIASPDGSLAINMNAPATLATAGSGDVLAGICTGLLAQGMPPFPAACAAVWLQAEAANIFGAGLISEDIIKTLPMALHQLEKYAKTVS
jgi:NAD(P)H-hydrate epimerase